MLEKLIIPQPVLPKQIPGYQLPQTSEHLLDWAFVGQQMSAALYYWVSTVSQKMQPHAVPVWGLWYEDRIYLEGSPQTTWARNAIHQPKVSVHLPSAEKVVLIEGRAQFLEDDDLDRATWQTIDTRYQAKYNVQKGSPWIVIHPARVMAWDHPNLQTMTCWKFVSGATA